jgi:hypothetical protein
MNLARIPYVDGWQPDSDFIEKAFGPEAKELYELMRGYP